MFNFNENESFSVNLEAFLVYMEKSDPDMAAILRANINKLLPVVQNGQRIVQARQDFNTMIAQALDTLITPTAK